MEHVYYPPTTREPGTFAARYVAYLIELPTEAIWEESIEHSDDGNATLILGTTAYATQLLEACRMVVFEDGPDLADDIRTLEHCQEVMNGVPTLVEGKLVTLYPDPRDNGWFDQGTFFNLGGYRRGAWTRWGRLLKGGSHG